MSTYLVFLTSSIENGDGFVQEGNASLPSAKFIHVEIKSVLGSSIKQISFRISSWRMKYFELFSSSS